MQKSICIIGILVTIMNISYSTNCINTIAIEAIQEEIKRGDIKKIAELCVDIKLTKIQHETLISYAKKIADEHHNNIIRRNIKIYGATALKALCLTHGVHPLSFAFFAIGLLDLRGIMATVCVDLVADSLNFVRTAEQKFIEILRNDFFGLYSGDKAKAKLCKAIMDEQRIKQDFWLTPGTVITIVGILLFVEYKAWKSQSKVKNELDVKYDIALRIVDLIISLPIDEIAETPQENIANKTIPE